jgi:hypothetical protein
MQPAATQIERVACDLLREGAPADALARFDHADFAPGKRQRTRGRNACGTRANHHTIMICR